MDSSDWRALAACANTYPGMFVPEPDQWSLINTCLDICSACPVTHECAQAAAYYGSTCGVWGGEYWWMGEILSIYELDAIKFRTQQRKRDYYRRQQGRHDETDLR